MQRVEKHKYLQALGRLRGGLVHDDGKIKFQNLNLVRDLFQDEDLYKFFVTNVMRFICGSRTFGNLWVSGIHGLCTAEDEALGVWIVVDRMQAWINELQQELSTGIKRRIRKRKKKTGGGRRKRTKGPSSRDDDGDEEEVEQAGDDSEGDGGSVVKRSYKLSQGPGQNVTGVSVGMFLAYRKQIIEYRASAAGELTSNKSKSWGDAPNDEERERRYRESRLRDQIDGMTENDLRRLMEDVDGSITSVEV